MKFEFLVLESWRADEVAHMSTGGVYFVYAKVFLLQKHNDGAQVVRQHQK